MRRRLLSLAALAALAALATLPPAPAGAAQWQVGGACSPRGHLCARVLAGRFGADLYFPAEGCGPVRVRASTEMVDEFRVCGTAGEVVHTTRPALMLPVGTRACVFAGGPVRDQVCFDVVREG